MADGIVGWHFFDAESGMLPEEFGPSILPGGGAGRIVVLAATPFARAEGWATKAVVSIVRGWADRELRIFLMDLGLDEPTLHEALGVPNQEGVSDAFLYGASVQRIAQPALDETIFFASSGTATTDPEQILAHPRWNDLAGGFSEADATLLLYLPTGLPGADRILNRATDVLFLAGQGESAAAHLGSASVKVLAMVGPMGSPPGEDGAEDASEVDEPDLADGPDGTLSEELFAAPEGDGTELEGALKLADGFVAEVADDGAPEEEEGASSFEPGLASGETFPAEIVLDEPVAPSGVSGEGDPGGAEDGGPPTETDFGGQGTPAQEVPDFGAEFADMPSLQEEASPPPSSPPMGEVIQGSAVDMGELPQHAGMSGEEGADDPDRGKEAGPIPPGARPDRFSDGRKRPMSHLRPKPRRRARLGAVAGILVIGAVIIAVAGTAAGWFRVPGFDWVGSVLEEESLPEVLVREDPILDPVLRYSLLLYSYAADERGLAVNMRNTLRERHPELLFNLTPAEVDGSVNYFVYAGPAADMVEAENLRAPLAETLFRDDSEAWRIRPTPYAFSLGRHDSRAEAEQAARSAEVRGAHAYVVQLTFPDSTTGFEVFSGAFETVEDTRWWHQALQEAGFQDVPLVERRGRPPE
jgi:hypothetical protein